MSFIGRLRKGVATIETEVKKLKELTEEGRLVTEDQLRDNLAKAKSFDADVRHTYAEMSQLLNSMRSSGDLLDESKNAILSLKQRLCDIEDNTGLKKFGYKPFTEQYFIDTISDNVFTDDNVVEEVEEVVDKPVDNHSTDEKTLSAKSLAKEFAQKTNISEERTTTVRFAPDMPVVNSGTGTSDRPPKANTKPAETKSQMVSKKYEKLLTRTPQPHDFGISRRCTILPQIYNRPDPTYTPEEPTQSFDTTCRFNYLSNNGLQLGSALNPLTPPNHSNGGDSFVTVEFTPGMTTKRPKGISRVQNNNPNNGTNNNVNQKSNDFQKQKETKRWADSRADTTHTQRLPQSILQSVENDKITPEQPILVTDRTKSAHILRSIAGKTSGTPPLPKSRIDANFHNQILKHL